METLQNVVKSFELLEKYVTDVMEARKVVVFGASGGGREAMRVLKELKKDLVCFVDNDELKWGKEIEGVPVLSPGELKQVDFDIIVVASSIGEADIISQLEEMGYKEKTYTLTFVRLLLWAKRFFKKLRRYFLEE